MKGWSSRELESEIRLSYCGRVEQLFENMETVGFVGGRVRIRHTENPKMAEALAAKIREIWPSCDIRIGANRGLCSYYCEPGGVLVGFEG